jgi:hypothetical protein
MDVKAKTNGLADKSGAKASQAKRFFDNKNGYRPGQTPIQTPSTFSGYVFRKTRLVRAHGTGAIYFIL